MDGLVNRRIRKAPEELDSISATGANSQKLIELVERFVRTPRDDLDEIRVRETLLGEDDLSLLAQLKELNTDANGGRAEVRRVNDFLGLDNFLICAGKSVLAGAFDGHLLAESSAGEGP